MRWFLVMVAAALLGGCAISQQRHVERDAAFLAIEQDPATIEQKRRTISAEERAQAARRRDTAKARAATEAFRQKLKQRGVENLFRDYQRDKK